MLQAPIEFRFQSSAGHGYTVVADLFWLTTLAQLESLLQQGLYPARKFRFPLSPQQNHLPTASQQMRQAALVQGMEKPAIGSPAIAHQKTGKVCAQHPRCLFKSPPRLNGIDRDLRGAEDPHPPQLPAHLPSRLIRGHTGTAANVLH